jgi:hypothetical protein
MRLAGKHAFDSRLANEMCQMLGTSMKNPHNEVRKLSCVLSLWVWVLLTFHSVPSVPVRSPILPG